LFRKNTNSSSGGGGGGGGSGSSNQERQIRSQANYRTDGEKLFIDVTAGIHIK
jgi:hypothetical protein